MKRTISVIAIVAISSLVFVSQASERVWYIDSYGFRPSLEDDTVFGNYTTDNTFTYYNRCTPSVRIDVYDPDGVDSVWLTYRRANETSMLNQTMDTTSLGRWNTYEGDFEVDVSLSETEFIVQFHCNDSLGYQSSSGEFSLFILYNPPDPPENGNYGMELLLGLSIVAIVVVGLFYLRKSYSKK
jgi:hypothetical protein